MRRRFAAATRQRATQSLMWLLLAVASPLGSEVCAYSRVQLSADVKAFDNENKPLIQTLFSIARTYHLPLGVELVTEEALQRPIPVRLEEGTIRQLLDLCVNQVPGYSWDFREGVIHVYGEDELKDASNGFNLVVPRFSVHGETLVSTDIKLEFAVMGLRPKPGEAQTTQGGVVGSYPGNPDPEMRPLSLDLHNATVREILNGLVVQFDGKVIWLSRLPPGRLSDPTTGFWKLVGPETDDPSDLLDLGRP